MLSLDHVIIIYIFFNYIYTSSLLFFELRGLSIYVREQHMTVKEKKLRFFSGKLLRFIILYFSKIITVCNFVRMGVIGCMGLRGIHV